MGAPIALPVTAAFPAVERIGSTDRALLSSRRATPHSGTTRALAQPGGKSLAGAVLIAYTSLPPVVQCTNLFGVKRIDTHTSTLAAHIYQRPDPLRQRVSARTEIG
jgi:hypothetical protein